VKILQITNKVPYPPKDGGSIATWNLTKGFADHGCQVTMLTMNTLKHYVDTSAILPQIRQTVDLHSVLVDTDIRAINALVNFLFSARPYNAARFISKAFKIKLKALLNDNEFDIIQLEGLYLCPYIRLIRRHSKALIALRAHNVEHQIWHRIVANTKGYFKRLYIQSLAHRICEMEHDYINKYDLLVPITQRDADVFIQMGNQKPIHVSPTGINPQEYEVAYSIAKFPSLFHLGALDWTPNQEGIIWFLDNCWNELLMQYPDLQFYIAGRNAPEWFVESIKRKNITFCGEVENAKEFIRTNYLMLVPLLSGSGMRIKIIEGMALGKPIITTSIGTEGIQTTHNENIIIATKPQQFIAEIGKFVIDRQKAAIIGKNARRFVEANFDNSLISKQLLDYYEFSQFSKAIGNSVTSQKP